MSLDYVAYLNDDISEANLFDFVVELGGTIQALSRSYSQGMLQKDSEIIWIKHDQKHFYNELDENEFNLLCNDFGIAPKTSIIISVGLDVNKKRSISLAKWFGCQLLLKHPNSVIDIDDMFYTIENISS